MGNMSISDLSTKLNPLLCDKNSENRRIFLNEIIPCVRNFAIHIYNHNNELFNRVYSFNDLVNDGIIEALELYDSFIVNNSNPFLNYYLILRKRMMHLLRNTSFYKACSSTINKVDLVLKTKDDYLKENGVLPTIKELQELSGCSKLVVNKAVKQVSIHEIESEPFEFEEDSLNKTIIEEISKLYMEELHKLSKRDQIIISLVFGLFNNQEHTYLEVGDMFGITKQRVYKICKDFLNSCKDDIPTAKEYLKEL